MSPFPLTNTPSNKSYFFNDTVFWKQKLEFMQVEDGI